MVASICVWFSNSAESSLKGLSPNYSQGKSHSRLGVQRLGPSTTLHDIIHSALSERE